MINSQQRKEESDKQLVERSILWENHYKDADACKPQGYRQGLEEDMFLRQKYTYH